MKSSPDPKEWNLTPFDLEMLGRVYGVEHLLNSIDKVYEGKAWYEMRVALKLYEMCVAVQENKYFCAHDEYTTICIDDMVQAMEDNFALVSTLDRLVDAYTKRLEVVPDTCLVAVLFLQIYRTEKPLKED